jgi:thiamine biosynthesis lipoprotein
MSAVMTGRGALAHGVEPPVPDPTVGTRTFRAIGTTVAVVVTDADRADEAAALLSEDLCALDLACSRFRADSELMQLEQTGGGRPVAVSPLLFDAIEVACVVAVQTAGTVDPTIGSALVELGYDRDFDQIESCGATFAARPRPAPGWWQIEMDPDSRTVAVPVGVHVDLGATAKALAADRSSRRIAGALDCGALVNLGGDVAVSGSCPTGGWGVGIAPRCTAPPDSVRPVVAVSDGGLATSGTTARSWIRNGRTVHHIVDPWTGEAARPVWSYVSVMAPSCVEANAWSTAAVVWGDDAPGNLAGFGVTARLVDGQGSVVHVGGWPVDASAPTGCQPTEGPRACRTVS